MTKTYIGVKVVTAWPQVGNGEAGDDRPGYAVKYDRGYISWSPADVFEEAYVHVPDEEAAGILLATRDELDRLASGAGQPEDRKPRGD